MFALSRSLNHRKVDRHHLLLVSTVSCWLLVVGFAASQAQAATFTVTNVNDSGAGSFRQAIIDTNVTPGGPHTITFNIGGAMGVKTISPTMQYPTVASLGLTIDGTTQPGYSGAPLIEINGTNAGANIDGLFVNNHNCVLKGLVINRFGGNGLTINGQSVTVQGCYIGTNAAGNTDLGNGKNGIWLRETGTLLGGSTTAARNVISGNEGSGILIEHNFSGADTVQGNYIGTDASGTVDLGNTVHGIHVKAANTVIGGITAAARNLISGNTIDGIHIEGMTSSGNVVQGNYIGTKADGATALPNSDNGVKCNDAPNNTVGGNSSGARNIISGNGNIGVYLSGANGNGNVVSGNFIGTNALASAAVPNATGGVLIGLAASNNFIGGTTSGERNIISGNNNHGILVASVGTTGNVIQGNFIGTNSAGATALPNASIGVWILNGATNTTVGGTTAGARNIISGNGQHGVKISNGTSQNNLVQGNFIGTNFANTAGLPNGGDGVVISATSNNTVGGTSAGAGNVISGNTGNGITIEVSGGTNTVQGNIVGLNLSGTAGIANGGRGIFISATSANTIGGTIAAARNYISANNGAGIEISGATAMNNLVQGNYIGTNKAGTAAIGNGATGVLLSGAPGNTIGGLVSGAGNVIAGTTGGGNIGQGIHIIGTGATSNLVQGNFIGTNAAGTSALGNGSNGVRITDAANNTVGGNTAAARNIISGNNSTGIRISGTATGIIVQGNYIGTKVDGVGALGNGGAGIFLAGNGSTTIGGAGAGAGNIIAFNNGTGVSISLGVADSIISNSIHSNGGLGIDLEVVGPTPNDAGDADAGSNNLQNFPVLAVAGTTGSSVSISGSLNSTASTNFRIEFFSNVSADVSGYGEGQTLINVLAVTTDAGGNASFKVSPAVSVPVGHFISATATNLTTNDTSEFSPAIEVTALTPESETNNTPATATPLDLATYPIAIATGFISPTGDVDFYKFTVPANTTLWASVDTGGPQNQNATTRDSVLTLFAPDGTTTIEIDDDDGVGNGGDSSIETNNASVIGGRLLQAGGTYYLRVQAFNNSGVISPYRLFVAATSTALSETEGNDTVGTANALVTPANPKKAISGAIGVAGDKDFFSVQANAGNTLFIDADGDPERDGVGTDLVIEVINPAGIIVLLSADSSAFGDASNPPAEGFNFNITTSGTYFVRVQHKSAAGTGTYKLMVAANNGQNQLGYKVVGRVYLSDGTSIPNVNVTRTGSATGVLTNAAGYYTFTNVPNGSVTITPMLSGYTFVPASRTVNVNGADIVNQNFVGSNGFIILGRVYKSDGSGIANVSVTRTGSAVAVFTNSAGYYSFINVPNGDYTVTPALSGYGFSPASRLVTIAGANSGNQNFLGASGYTIIGRVTNSGNVGVSGVSVARTGSATPAITNSAGYYTFYDVPDGDYVLTPTKNGLTFTPVSKNVTVAGANLSGKNFIASP